MCNTYCFFIATVITRTRLSGTIYVLCVSFCLRISWYCATDTGVFIYMVAVHHGVGSGRECPHTSKVGVRLKWVTLCRSFINVWLKISLYREYRSLRKNGKWSVADCRAFRLSGFSNIAVEVSQMKRLPDPWAVSNSLCVLLQGLQIDITMPQTLPPIGLTGWLRCDGLQVF